jgi:hypothetical protein
MSAGFWRMFVCSKARQSGAYCVLYELFFRGIAQLGILFYETLNFIKKLRRQNHKFAEYCLYRISARQKGRSLASPLY